MPVGADTNFWILTMSGFFLTLSLYVDYYIRSFTLNGYSSGQSFFLETNVKLAEGNKFVTYFVQKCLDMREKEQDVVLSESSEALGNRSEIVRILVLAMTTAGDCGADGSTFVREVDARF